MSNFELNCLLSYDDDALLVELRRVAELIDAPYITRAAFDQHAKVSSSAIQKRFGGWKTALLQAGLEDRYNQTVAARRSIRKTFTDEELIAELLAIAQKTDGTPVTIGFFNQHALMNAETVRRRFGSWWAALKKAGLPIANLGKRYSEEEYFENLLSVWTHYGRQPKYREMDYLPSSIPSGAYEAKWGSWRKALIAFVERINSDTQQEAQVAPSSRTGKAKTKSEPRQRHVARSNNQENQRDIKLGLRYELLKRDRFRCVLCGASPAIQLGCILHVDHIVPFSKGGKTIIGNLRTLCEKCNLGKSAKFE